jgi:hypothetical protein
VQILEKLQRVVLDVSEVFEQFGWSRCGKASDTNARFGYATSEEVKQSLSSGHFEVMPGRRRHNHLQAFAFQPRFDL